MAVDAAPIVDEADEDEDDDHDDLDHGEPVLGLACLHVRRLISATLMSTHHRREHE